MQHLSNTWSSIHEKLSNAKAGLKKDVAYEKSVYSLHGARFFSSSFTEAVTRSFSVKKVFLKILKIHRKTPVSESLFK